MLGSALVRLGRVTSVALVVTVGTAGCAAAAQGAAAAPGIAATLPAADGLGLAAAPRFFIDDVLSSGAVSGGLLQVRLAATGALVSQPAIAQALAVAPLSSRTFAIARLAGTCGTQLYRATLSAQGSLGGLSRLGPVLPGEAMAMAASADGNAVALAMGSCSKAVPGYLAVLNLGTGTVRRWAPVSVGGSAGGRIALSGGLSLSADGRLLAFTGDTTTAEGTVTGQGVWVLPTTAGTGSVARHGRLVLRARRTGPALDAVILSHSGTSLYLCGVSANPASRVTQIAVYTTSRGRPTVTIASLTAAGPTSGQDALGCPMAADPSGSYLLVPYSLRAAGPPQTGPMVTVAAIDLRTRAVNKITFRLPGSAGMSVADAITIGW